MYQIPFHQDTFRPGDDLIPGNSTAVAPVEFDLSPAGGPDLARIKSILFADLGLVGGDWSPESQRAVLAAFDQGAQAFVNTVDRVRGLSVPAAMALKVGLIDKVPTKANPAAPSEQIPDAQAPVPIMDGLQFSRVASYHTALGMGVALRILELSGEAGRASDQRFFDLPGGSGGTGTRQQKIGNAGRARRTSRKRGTADGTPGPESRQPGTSQPN